MTSMPSANNRMKYRIEIETYDYELRKLIWEPVYSTKMQPRKILTFDSEEEAETFAEELLKVNSKINNIQVRQCQ